jgi:hypothetical protein
MTQARERPRGRRSPLSSQNHSGSKRNGSVPKEQDGQKRLANGTRPCSFLMWGGLTPAPLTRSHFVRAPETSPDRANLVPGACGHITSGTPRFPAWEIARLPHAPAPATSSLSHMSGAGHEYAHTQKDHDRPAEEVRASGPTTPSHQPPRRRHRCPFRHSLGGRPARGRTIPASRPSEDRITSSPLLEEFGCSGNARRVVFSCSV